MRAKGMIEHDGRWMTLADAAALDAGPFEREAAVERRDAEEAELAAQRAQLSAQQAELDAQASHLPPDPYFSGYYGGYYAPYGYGYGYARAGACFGRPCGPSFRAPRPAPGVTARRFDDTSLSVVKVPYRHH
jgi:hypothetical protein